jgi:sigma-B regulation protein RsbU (phosphoserine phosphatase)
VVHADHATVLHAGESLVIFSDGLLEATDRAGRFYGAARMHRELSRLAGAPAEAITAEFARQVAAFADGEIAEDDVTIMAVCCGAAS